MNQEKKYKIEIELDQHEVDVLDGILGDYIKKHRYEAKLKYLCNEITNKEMDWSLKHSLFVEVIATKIFPEFTIQ